MVKETYNATIDPDTLPCIWTPVNFNPGTLDEEFRVGCKFDNFITRMPIDEMQHCHLCGMKVVRG